LYWSISSSNGNGKELFERFTSIIYHICNRHKFIHNEFYKECGHEILDPDKQRTKAWLQMGSPAHEQLSKIVKEKMLMKDLEKYPIKYAQRF